MCAAVMLTCYPARTRNDCIFYYSIEFVIHF